MQHKQHLTPEKVKSKKATAAGRQKRADPAADMCKRTAGYRALLSDPFNDFEEAK
jgi:hypothetical protein